MKQFRYLSWVMMWFILLVTMRGIEDGVLAQVIGNLAEMDRLEQRAEELTAQADPEGASQAFGKAAMMADILSKDTHDPSTQVVFQAASLLYRAQERGLRAVALFERTGGQPPAPAGVCQFLVHAAEMVKKSKNELEALPNFSNESMRARRQHHLAKTKKWGSLLQGLQQDFSC